MATATKITATWNESTGQYVTDCGWHSQDGDNWEDGSGLPVVSAEFDAATIVLDGGKRNGDVVS